MDWKTWKNGNTFSSQGEVREFWADWKCQGILPKILEKLGNDRQNESHLCTIAMIVSSIANGKFLLWQNDPYFAYRFTQNTGKVKKFGQFLILFFSDF